MATRSYLCCITLLSATLQFARAQAPTGVPSISLVGAAFDEDRNRLVIAGGHSDTASTLETWEFDGTRWTRFRVPGPSPRNEARMVYDRAHKRIVLFGGDRGRSPAASDTWSWDGREWRQLATDGPGPRAANMVYDSRRDRIVLFGGGSATGALFNDTWEWDGQRWLRVVADSQPTSPPARALAGLAYDERRGRVVLTGGFAGFDAARRVPRQLDDTWEWDGRAWKKIDGPSPGARDHVELIYDRARGAVVLHGGGLLRGNSPALVGDTWQFDGSAWTKVADDGPPRGRHRLVFDPRANAILLYGGWGPSNVQSTELWRLEGTRWRLVSP